MRLLFKLCIATVLLASAVVVVLAVLALQDQPAVESTAELSAANVRRVRALAGANDPRKLPAGAVRTLRLNEADLQLGAHYVATRAGRGGARVTLGQGSMLVIVSSELPTDGAADSRHYLNVTVRFEQAPSGPPTIAALRIGSVPVPAIVANAALVWMLHNVPGTSASAQRPLDSLVREVTMLPGELALTYEWLPDLLDDIRSRVVSPEDRKRLEFYQRALAQIAPTLRKDNSIVKLLRPMFAHALKRSVAGEAIAENRALLLVLSAYSNGRGLVGLVPAAATWPKAKRVQLKLRNRRDSAQHFLTSAGLVVLGGKRFSNVIGLAKEVADAGGGSGFSFTDIAADRAGTRFGEMALYSQRSARALQRTVAAGVADSALAPRLHDLPEYLSEAEFAQRYTNLSSPAYKAEIARIEKRLATLSLYRL